MKLVDEVEVNALMERAVTVNACVAVVVPIRLVSFSWIEASIPSDGSDVSSSVTFIICRSAAILRAVI